MAFAAGSDMADMNTDLPAADSGKLNFPDLSCSADLMNQIDLTDSVAVNPAAGPAAGQADPMSLTDLSGSAADPRDQTDLTDCP